MKRRDFIRTTISGSMALGMTSEWACANAEDMPSPSVAHGAEKSRVVIASRSDVRSDKTINADSVQKMVDSAVENLFQQKARFVWRTLFSPDDTVGLKVNCLAGKLFSTHQEIIWSVVERLKEAGVKKNQIIIWDRWNLDLERAGYKLQTRSNDVRCYGNDHVGFTRRIFEYGSVGSQLSKILYEQCTKVINFPVLRDHGIAGITGALKNYFGAINNPNKYHINCGDPYIADLNRVYPIRKKSVLTLCDALTAQYEGGPPLMSQWAWNMDSMLSATDPVAMDQIIWDIIEEKRAENGIESLEADGRKPTYIATAADKDHQCGTNDREKITMVKV